MKPPAALRQECGTFNYNDWCQFCRERRSLAGVHIPYACKLLLQELQAMNIMPRLGLQRL